MTASSRAPRSSGSSDRSSTRSSPSSSGTSSEHASTTRTLSSHTASRTSRKSERQSCESLFIDFSTAVRIYDSFLDAGGGIFISQMPALVSIEIKRNIDTNLLELSLFRTAKAEIIERCVFGSLPHSNRLELEYLGHFSKWIQTEVAQEEVAHFETVQAATHPDWYVSRALPLKRPLQEHEPGKLVRNGRGQGLRHGDGALGRPNGPRHRLFLWKGAGLFLLAEYLIDQ